MNISRNNNNNNNENVNPRYNVRAGSGRLAKKLTLKALPSSSSLDEPTMHRNTWRDNNNNQRLTFRRTSSTNCLQDIQKSQLCGDRTGASREA